MIRPRRLSLIATIAWAVVLAPDARAQTTWFGADVDRWTPTNAREAQSLFQSALSAYGVETFATAAYARPMPLTFGDYGHGQVDNPTFYPAFDQVSGYLGVQGERGYATAFGGFDAAPISWTFGGKSVSAFGLITVAMNDMGASNGPYAMQLDFFSGGVNVFSWAVSDPYGTQDNTMFVGITGLTFDRVEMRGERGDAFWLNEATIGDTYVPQNTLGSQLDPSLTATPEPATALLLAPGLIAAIGGMSRRRRTA